MWSGEWFLLDPSFPETGAVLPHVTGQSCVLVLFAGVLYTVDVEKALHCSDINAEQSEWEDSDLFSYSDQRKNTPTW